ncbi:sulfatase [Prosthecobacter sp.]|jgi:N-sulfoglucosamine sulfohydrolase|uniref:sulfatase family protein n=1 Tax=Prosthecobacter sp. TaxID=1965333 RepID=UPI0025D8DADD|nr:sulfatase [Prosthecobacter sp.]
MIRMLFLLALMAGHVQAKQPNILLLIGDNWSYEHAGANGDKAVRTPVFDRMCREGMRFTNAFCPVPSCSPTRSCIVTGRVAHQLVDAASLWSKFPGKLRVFGDELSKAGWHVGFTGKGWSPGNFIDFGRELNPAGAQFEDFASFMQVRKEKQPFFFWFGSTHTSLNKWKEGLGEARGIDPAKVRVPKSLPDVSEVREEITDYLAQVELMDEAFGGAIALLETNGELDNTVVIHTSDNGWQMPHGLAHCYDDGTHVPLAVRWPGKVKRGSVSADFISLTDLAPTFLEIAGLQPWPEMTAHSFVDVLMGKPPAVRRDHVFIERERHANVRRGDLSYPVRGVRTAGHLYLRNLRPERWPAGDPELYFAVGPYGDIDGSRTKAYMMTHAGDPKVKPLFEISFGKRPAEELYDLKNDPDQVVNLAADPRYEPVKAELARKVDTWMRETDDPRAADPATNVWDAYPYFGGPAKDKRAAKK